MTAIAAFRTMVSALLNDPTNALYTTANIDSAINLALETYSRHNPLLRTYSLDTDGNQRIELPADFNATAIKTVEWVKDFTFSDQITFYAYLQDEQWIIETTCQTIPSGEVLCVSYCCLHTIDGLNNASGTTIPSADENLLACGAAGEAARQRAISKTEANNLNPGEAEMLVELYLSLLTTFEQNLGFFDTGFQTSNWNDSSIDKAY